jgi:hypothetical protein
MRRSRWAAATRGSVGSRIATLAVPLVVLRSVLLTAFTENGEQATRVPGFVKRARARCSAFGALAASQIATVNDYVRVNPFPAARTALLRIDHWMEDYNSEHPHPVYRSPREYIASIRPAECPV